MAYEKMEPIKGGPGGCLHCGYQHETLPMDAVIAVGFGVATVTKNKRVVYDESATGNDEIGYGSGPYWTVQDAEDEALKDPDNDWRIQLVAPLSERYYQRQGEGLWVLYKRGQGFV